MRPITEFSGSVLVTCDGVTLLTASAGEADASAGKPCSAESRFQIASVSKQFTAAAVMLLVDDGALDLDDHIGRLLPGCAPQWRDLTLHQLPSLGYLLAARMVEAISGAAYADVLTERIVGPLQMMNN